MGRTGTPVGVVVIIAILSNLIRLLLLPIHVLRRHLASARGGYVTLDIDGRVVDLQSSRSRAWLFRPRAHPPLSIAWLRRLGRMLAHDKQARGLLVRIRSLSAGPAAVSSLRDALAEIRASGKDVVLYLPQGADNKSILLASAARRVIVGPHTTVAPLGYAVVGRYIRRALERAGVEPEVFAKGTYKSAGEALVRDGMSDAQREQVGALLETNHQMLVSALAQGRNVDREVARRWIDEAPYGAADAVSLGLVDAVAYEDEVEMQIQAAPPAGPNALLPAGPGGQPLAARAPVVHKVSAERYFRARHATRLRPLRSKPLIGVIEVHGAIVSRARFGLGPLAAEDRITAALRTARASSAIRGVILHIDSPGGSALASDRIYHEVLRLAEVKPVVAYLSNVAASGGYYIAAAAHCVVAQPQSVTGSIGVVSARFVFGPLLERLGVFTHVVKRGARADLFSTERRLNDGERAVMEREIEGFYRAFVEAVAKGRKRTPAEIEPLAQGRVYSGAEAHACGLVDLLGGFERAVHRTGELAGMRGQDLEPRVIRPPRHSPPPAPLVPQVATALDAMGLGSLRIDAQLCLHLEGEHMLTYWDGAAAE